MDQPKKQDITTGNGHTKTPILGNGKDRTVVKSQQFPKRTSIGAGSTKPVSVPEALSLLQTLCLDLRSMDCKVAILARNNRLYIIGDFPASIGNIAMKDGHITINGQPVSKG